jgi:LysR family glycine cleavage system transcriptional activator
VPAPGTVTRRPVVPYHRRQSGQKATAPVAVAARRGVRQRGRRESPAIATRRPKAATTRPLPLRRLPLGSLRVFVAVAQHLNVSHAADALGVSPSAASLQVRALEEYLQRPLFRRNGRGVSLTTDGAALLPRVQQALESLERAIDDTRAPRCCGPLRVTMLVSFLQQWLLPRLGEFSAHHPEIDLHVHTSVAVVDFAREEIHAAIRFGLGKWPGLQAEKVIDDWLVPVCAPALLARHGPVRGVDDLKRYPLLHSTSEPWTSWLLGGRIDDDRHSPGRGARFDDSVTLTRAAAQGHGLALTRWSLAAQEVSDGELAVAGTPVLYDRSYWFVTPTRSRDMAEVRAFREWLLAEGARWPPPPDQAA